MGSSSSKPQYYHPPNGYLPQGSSPYQPHYQGQFGYYIQQVGDESGQVQAIPGYYYPPDYRRGKKPRYKRHNSAPMLSTSGSSPPHSRTGKKLPPPPSDQDPVAPTSAEAPLATSAVSTAEPATEPVPEPAPPDAEPAPKPPSPAAAAVPEVSMEPNTNTDPLNEPASQPAPAVASAPAAPAQPELTNPLPHLPRNVLDTDRYRHLRRAQTNGSAGMRRYYAAPVASVAYKPHLRSQYRPTGRDPVLKPPRPHEELIPREEKSKDTGGGAFKLLRSLTMPSLYGSKIKKSLRSPDPLAGYTYPYPISGPRAPIPAFRPVPPAPPVPAGPPITIPLKSPLNPTSPHKVLYKKKLYPTAAHLFEAQKFMKQRPELAERIRTFSDDAAEMSMLCWNFQMNGWVRDDWELVWRDKMDEVLYLKFVQHPALRAQLLATGYASLLDGNEVRRPDAEGVNELGKALMRLRERLRREGARPR